jgi:hypothetical protein
MTDTRGAIVLTPEADARLGEYLAQVRSALAGSPDVSPDEIEADIREHVENELRGRPRPVGVAALEEVLARLGPPAQWAAGERPSPLLRARHLMGERLRGTRAALGERLRAAREALWRGPEDWRLAYLSFGVLALGALTFFAFPLALLVSYVLSRAGLAVAKEKGVVLSAGQKWLLYPPVVLVSLALFVALAAFPAGAAAVAFGEVESASRRVREFDRPNPVPPAGSDWRRLRDWQDRQAVQERMASQVEDDRALLATVPAAPGWKATAAGWFVGVGAVALWWTVLGFVGASYPRAVRAVFPPLGDRFERSHGLWLAVPCLAVSVAWVFVAYQAAAGAGLV